MHEDQTSMFLNSEKSPDQDWLQLHHIIVDRGSKYSVTIGKVNSSQDIASFLDRLKKDKKYNKATHNSYASRITKENQILDNKSDDGETGAGMIILRILHRNNFVNTIIVVTRWFGGVKLYNDRFKHIVDATQEAIDQVK